MMNEIILGDCLEVLKSLPDKSLDCVFTDPPYKQEFHGRGLAQNRHNYLKIKNYGSDTKLDYTEFFNLAVSKLKKINIFIFCDKETKYDFITLAKKNKFGYKEIAFCKTSPTPFIHQWLSDIEWGLHIFKGLEIMGNYHTKRSFFIMNNFKEKGINHPTPKKIEIIEKILKNITKENDLVFDGFSGSGTTAVACKRMNRRFICVEKNDVFWKDSVERLRKEDGSGV